MSTFKVKGKWAAKFYLDGKQYWVKGGPWDTEREAKKAEQRFRDRLRARKTDETCASFTERWLAEWPRKSENTQRTYKDAVKRFAVHFGSRALGEIERPEARSWALTVPRGVSRVVSVMYEDARNIGLVDANPFSNLRLPAQDQTGRVLAPTLDEYRTLLGACTAVGGYATEFRALLTFTAWSGLRAGEVMGLRWEDVETEHLHVRRQRLKSGSLAPPKNGHARRIPLLPPARVLDQVPHRSDGFVFHAPRGGPLHNGSLSYSWREVRASSGIPEERKDAGHRNIRFHDLRHFFAFRLKDLGADPYSISLAMGHRDGGVLVIERYGMGGEQVAGDRLLALFDDKPPQIGRDAGRQQIAEGHR